MGLNSTYYSIRYILFCCALAFLFLSIPVGAQNYLFDNWQVKDGLPQNTITEIIQTQDGYIWISTEGGLTKFDGVRFTNFDVHSTPAFRSNRIGTLYENKNGDLLIATSENLVLFRNGEFEDLTARYTYKFNRVVAITENKLGQLILLSNLGYQQRMDPETYQPFERTAEESKELEQIEISTSLLGKGARPKDWNSIILRKDLQNAVFNNEAIMINADSLIFWYATNDRITLFKGFQILKRFSLAPYFEEGSKPCLLKMGTTIYILNRNGNSLLILNEETSEMVHQSLPRICPEGSLSCMLIDREKNLWLGTSICGLIKVKPNRFSYLDADTMQFNKNIYPILQGSDGRIMIGSSEDGLLAFDENNQRLPLPEHPILNKGFLSSIAEHNQKYYLSSVIQNCIFRIEEDGLTKIPFPNNLYTQANALYENRAKQLLVGAHEGLYELVGDSLQFHSLNKQKYVRFVNTLYEDRDDNLWVLTILNAFKYNPNTNTVLIDFKERWPHIQEYRGIHEDEEGTIYLGTYGFGLCVLYHDSLFQITTQNGLQENVVSTITEDGRGNIWLTGNKGLTRIRKKELLKIIEGKKTTLSAVIFNENSDALRSGEFNGGIQQAKFHLNGNRYLFPTLKGAVIVDFDHMLENKLAPNVLIETIHYNDTTFDTRTSASFDYTDERLEFRFTALSFVAPDKVRFKYQLQGYESEWNDGGGERRVVYNKLPPGKYTFRVIASNDEDVWNMDGASYSFEINPPFYLTWWFRSLAMLMALTLIVATVRWYVLRGQKIQKDKSAMLDILPDLVFKIDRQGKYIDIYGNPSALIAPADILKNSYLKDFLPEKLAKTVLEVVNQAIESQEIQQFKYDLVDASGNTKHFEGRFIAIDKREVLCIIRDTTESRQADEQIRSSETRLRKALEKEKKLLKKLTEQQKIQLESIIDTEEKERRRIAADLHDGLGQLLSSVKINLGVAGDKIEEDKLKESAVLVNKSKIAIDLITAELRNISYNLLPPSIEQFGLASSIEEQVMKLSVDPNRRIFFDHSLTDIKFDQKVEVVLYRVFQELVNNSIKHSLATEITLQLIQHDKEIVFMIEDNGKGFDIEKGFLKKDSSGLKNIQSRINLIKGKLNIDSQPGTGTSITIKIPI